MINLEWLRTFRAVYRTKSLSKAAEILKISQPAVSQHLSNLEAHVNQKLFDRKSKGVVETDKGRLLNTLVAGSIESLEGVENMFGKKESKLNDIVTLGISEHLYKSILCQKHSMIGDYVHIRFGKRQELVRAVEDGMISYAVIPQTINTFDTLSYALTKQNLVLVGTPDIDFEALEKLFQEDMGKAELWLNQQTWFAHDAASSYIKVFWLHLFNKKRPAIIPAYVIPNEFEVLFQLSQGSGLTVAIDTVASGFCQRKTLKAFKHQKIYFRDLTLIANKNKTRENITRNILKVVKGRLNKECN